MQFQIDKRGGRRRAVRPEFTVVGADRIIGSTVWVDEDGRRIERYQVLTIREDKIVDIQGCETKREAERFATRRRTG
ncbi:MAG: hypothetical protein JOY72_11320 [Actinobacteria bacterium]|nr:hypothetical protein [Actinomycetota bacterium]